MTHLPCDKIFHPLTNFITNATEDRKSLLIASYARRRRVLKVSVNALGFSGEHRAGLFRVVADCNHSIEFLADELIHRFRPVTRYINADLPHYLNGLRSNAARLYAGAFNFKSVSAVMPQDAFGHLTAGGIPGTKNQYSSLHQKSSLPVSGPSAFPLFALRNAASSCGITTSRAFSGSAGASRRNRSVAAAAPISCARIKPGASAGRMPANVLLKARASVTAGFANEVEAVNQ